MNAYTENTGELIKIFYFSEWCALSSVEFSRVMDKWRRGRYELIIIEEE